MGQKKSDNSQQITWLLNEKHKGVWSKKAARDIGRLEAGEPVDYVIGYKKFLGCKIDLRYKPLIPRDETEFWVGEAIQDLQRPSLCKLTERWSLEILDMFAGSGCCGIAVLKHIPKSRCDFVDIDDNCLKQIRLNLKINNIGKNRYRVIKSDMFKALSVPDTDSGYDLVLANPPYASHKNKSKVQKPVLQYEPRKALFARNKGLFFIEKLLGRAKNFLSETGGIFLEFSPEQKNQIFKLAKKFRYSRCVFFRDQFNKWRTSRIDF
ncbi:MAG: HemK family protein methyltransferase [Patescibacteria group bacterium]|nr:HemK family protein methyltransferase [Patescibacteria group bacterium]